MVTAAPNATVAAPTNVTLEVPAGFAAYAWTNDGACPGGNLTAATGATTRALVLTSSETSATVFNVAAGPVSCSFKVTVTNSYGVTATTAPFAITVR